MSSVGARLSRARLFFRRVSFSSRPSIEFTPRRRFVLASPCSRYQSTPLTSQLSEVPADTPGRTIITEDVERSTAGKDWDDPREAGKANADKTREGTIDPTIRHFTVNFVRFPLSLNFIS
jgi:hypothetical protein